MGKKELKDYNNVFTTKNVDERNQLIVKLCNEGKEYFYTGLQSDGTYEIGWNE